MTRMLLCLVKMEKVREETKSLKISGFPYFSPRQARVNNVLEIIGPWIDLKT